MNQEFNQVCRLQFANDTLFFQDNDKHEVKALEDILVLFNVSSNLKVNFNKSTLFQVGILEDIGWATEMQRCDAGIFLQLTWYALWWGRRCGRKSLRVCKSGWAHREHFFCLKLPEAPWFRLSSLTFLYTSCHYLNCLLVSPTNWISC